MNPGQVQEYLDRLLGSDVGSSMPRDRGEQVTELIVTHGLRHVLELGFFAGVSTSYFAAALEATGGELVTIDLAARVQDEPGAYAVVEQLGVTTPVTMFYEYSSFNWRLCRFLDQPVRPGFDLVYLDAGHSWEVTGMGFLVAEQLVQPGGWMIFDDLNWTFDASPSQAARMRERGMPADERTIPQVGRVFDLLVRPHPRIAQTWTDSRWGWARKDPVAPPPTPDAEEGLRVAKLEAAATRRAALARYGLVETASG